MDNIAYFFKMLSIDVFKNFSFNIDIIDKLFFILFVIFQNIEFINIINLLANNTFKYQIIFINSTIVFINLILYSFTISTNLQYDKSKLKELLIDSNTMTKSKSNVNQLKTL